MIAVYGYLATAALYVVLSVALLAVWRDRQGWARILLVSLVSAAWAVVYVAQAVRSPNELVPLLVADTLRVGAWYGLLGALLSSLGLSQSRRRTFGALWLIGFVVTLVGPLVFQWGAALGRALLSVQLLLAVGGVVLVEQLLRNVAVGSRWAVKYLGFGIGLGFAFDLYLFSESVLFGGVSPGLMAARGYVSALGAAAIAVGVRRNPRFDLGLSHGMVFFLGSVVAVGAYLMVMALGAYFVSSYGGDWVGVAQPVFLAAAGLGLLVLLFSDTARGRFKVFLGKHFQRYKYDYRQEWLRFTRTLSQAAGEADIPRTSLEAMAQIVGSPGGALWMVDEDTKKYHLMVTSPPASEIVDVAVDAEDPLVAFMVERRWIIDLRQLVAEPARYAGLSVPAWLAQRSEAWLVIPLLLGSRLVGFVVLDEAPVTDALNFEDHDLLKMVGRDVASHVSQYEASRRLAEGRQFAASHQLAVFVMHDLKNVMAQLSLVVRNAEKHKRNPAFVDDAIATIGNSVERMSSLSEQLRNGVATAQQKRVSLRQVVEAAIARASARGLAPRLVCESADAEVFADAQRLGNVLEHVVNNAQDASDPNGEIVVTLKSDATTATVSVVDKGKGMAPEFMRHHLFKPFTTTKGEAGMGIGAYQVREYVRLLGGNVAVASAPGAGTRFDICLPIAPLRAVGDNRSAV